MKSAGVNKPLFSSSFSKSTSPSEPASASSSSSAERLPFLDGVSGVAGGVSSAVTVVVGVGVEGAVASGSHSGVADGDADSIAVLRDFLVGFFFLVGESLEEPESPLNFLMMLFIFLELSVFVRFGLLGFDGSRVGERGHTNRPR